MPQIFDAEPRGIGDVAKLLAVPRTRPDRMGQQPPELLLLEVAELLDRPVLALHKLHERPPAPRSRATIRESVEKRRDDVPECPPRKAAALLPDHVSVPRCRV